jgi:UDP:flavonoid glycosyltransferase YjiC (YdhE family)
VNGAAPLRVAVSVFPAASHLFPLVPLAWALRTAGHEVRLAVPPGFAPAALRTGLPVLPLGRDVDPGAAWEGFRGDPSERTARTMAMFRATAEGTVGELVELARNWADLVLYDPRSYAGPVAAAVAGVPSVRFLYGVDHTWSQRETEWPLLAPLWEAWGLDAREPGGSGPAGSRTLDPCPAALQCATPATSHRVRHIPYNGAARVPAVLDRFDRRPGARPRVCVTWGASSGAAAGHLEPLRRTVHSLTGLGLEVLVLVAAEQRRLLGELPAGTTVLESVPLHLVLAGCALVVHQGGAGTTLTAAVCGVPQVVLPAKGDQLVHAERVVAAGVGRALGPSPEFSAADVRAAVQELLGDVRVRDRAAGLAEENTRRPAPAELVGLLSGLAGPAPDRKGAEAPPKRNFVSSGRG